MERFDNYKPFIMYKIISNAKKKQKSKTSLNSLPSNLPKNKNNSNSNKKQESNYPSSENQLLYKKYSSQNVDYTASSEVTQFINGLSIQYPGGLGQFQKQYYMKEYLQQYMNLGKTKTIISVTIRKAAQKFKIPFIHFYDPAYYILRKQTRGIFNQEKSYRNPGNRNQITNEIIKEISNKPPSIKKSKSLKKGNKKNTIKGINQSFCHLKDLCNKIGIMCNEGGKNKSNRLLSGELHIKNLQGTPNDKQRKFKQDLDQNFSKIQSKITKSKEKLKSPKKKGHLQKQPEDIYGLSYKKAKNKESAPRLKMQGSNKRLATERQMTQNSPVSQAYYNKQFNFTEFRGEIKKQRLLTSYSSKKEKKKSSEKADKNLQAYLKVFKSKSQKQILRSPSQKDFRRNKKTRN